MANTNLLSFGIGAVAGAAITSLISKRKDLGNYVVYKSGEIIRAHNVIEDRIVFEDTDATQVINAALTDMVNGRLYIHKGVYPIDQITIGPDIILEGSGHSTTLEPLSSTAIKMTGARSVIRNFRIAGNGNSTSTIIGIKNENTDHTLIDNCSFYGLGQSIYANTATKMWIQNCNIRQSSNPNLSNIHLNHCADYRLINDIVRFSRGNQIEIAGTLGGGPDGGGQIHNCYISRAGFYSQTDPVPTTPKYAIKMKGHFSTGITGTIVDANTDGILAENVFGLWISDSSITDSKRQNSFLIKVANDPNFVPGLPVSTTKNIVISHNDMRHPEKDGIIMDSINGFVVEGNTLSGNKPTNSSGTAIQCINCSDGIITNNYTGELYSNKGWAGDGIFLDNTRKCIVNANRISKCRYGIKESASCDRNIITSNSLYDNSYPILLQGTNRTEGLNAY